MALADSGADDALFIRIAHSLASGGWLGPYDNLTLAKGMFYPLFIAMSAWAAIPLKMAEHLVYLGAAALCAAYVRRRSGSVWLGTALFVLLAFNPVFWDRQLARVIREGLYISLSLGVVALTVGVCFSHARFWRRAALGCGLGLLTGCFWLTREEGPWIIPALATVCLVGVYCAWRGRPNASARLHDVRSFAVPLVLAGLVFALVNGAVAQMNGRAYGNDVTTEFKSRSFLRAYGALAGVKPAEWQRYVVWPRDARARVYAVSPAARELAPFFEGAGGESWRRIGCEQMWLDRAACPEILSGWFMWALRDAVTATGHANTARDARRFYDRLADEVDASCRDGKLACVASNRATLIPPFRWQYIGDTLRRSGLLFRIVFTLGGGNLQRPPSQGMQPELSAFADLAGPIAAVTGPVQQRITGWVAASTGIPSVAVQAAPGVTVTRQYILDGADVEQFYPGLKAARFEIVSSCQPGRCSLVVAAPGQATVALPWSNLAVGYPINSDGEKMYLETVSSFDAAPVSTARAELQRRVARVIYPFYGVGFPILSALGAAGLLFALSRRKADPVILALTAGSLAAIMCRVMLLAYLDVTSIPSANSLYASPASPFVILFATLGIFMGLSARREKHRPPAPEQPLSPG